MNTDQRHKSQQQDDRDFETRDYFLLTSGRGVALTRKALLSSLTSFDCLTCHRSCSELFRNFFCNYSLFVLVVSAAFAVVY